MSLTDWNTYSPPSSTQKWKCVAFGNGTFVAGAAFNEGASDDLINSGSLNEIMTSTDNGQTWTARSNTKVTQRFWGATFGNDRFLLSGLASGEKSLISTDDGVNWSSADIEGGSARQWWDADFGNNIFVSVGYAHASITGYGVAAYSNSTGNSWTTTSPATTNKWSSVVFGNGIFVAVSRNGTGNRVMTTTDGIVWTSQTSAADEVWNSVTYGNDMFVAVGDDGSIMTGTNDGITWTSRTSPTSDNWNRVSYGTISGEKLFVAVGDGGAIMTSSDGETWLLDTSPTSIDLYGIGFGNDTFVAVGQNIVITATLSIPPPIPRCFKSGTYILCKTIDDKNAKEEIKQIKVEDLTIGTLVKTKYDGFKPIVKIITGEIKNNPQYQHSVTKYNKNQLYVCPTHNFNELFEDLVITSNHCILAFPISEDKKKQILDFMGDIYVTDHKYRIPACLDERCIVYPEEGTFTIYHFALEKECQLSNYGVFANGLLVETASIFDVNSDGH